MEDIEHREGERVPRAELIPEGWLNRICKWWAIPSGVVLVFVMLAVTVDVLLRRFANAPIAEVYDMAILGLLVSTFCAIAWVMTIKGHIEADILFRKYPPRVKRVISSIALTLSIFPAVTIAWGALIWMESVIRVWQVTLVLRWPLAPFIGVEIVGAALLGLVVLVQAVNSLRVRRD